MNRSVVIGSLLILMGLSSCANRGVGPQGGPIDSIPPSIVRTNPDNGCLNYTKPTIDIYFNEYIQLDGSTDNILVSPPQQRPPEIKVIGKHIHVAFQDTLQPNTTYTIDFANYIVDNNEKNPYPEYAFSFSTGDAIDSLEIYGQLINAENLNPMSGVVVGLHSNLHDSAFTTQPFTRIGRTDENGEFSIKNIHAGTYRLYALHDQSRDYIYQPGEAVAFVMEPITPRIDVQIEHDTIWKKDTLDAQGHKIADSIYTSEYYYYEPSELLLKCFKEDKRRIAFQRVIRENAHYFQLIFSAPQQDLPTLRALRLEQDSLAADTTWVNFLDYCVLQPSTGLDTLTYWLTDSAAIKMDSIRFELTYMKTDSVYQLQPQTDTIMAIYRAPRLSAKVLAQQKRKEKALGLQINANVNKKFNIYDTICILSPTPIARIERDSVHLLEYINDSTSIPVSTRVQLRDSSRMAYQVIARLRHDADYDLVLDSGAVVDVYGKTHKKETFIMHVRPQEDYATLTIRLATPCPNAIIQLLDTKDQPVRQMPVTGNNAAFRYVEPGSYYLRMFVDTDHNGRWTTGDWLTKRQPEEVYYFRKKLTLRANWDFEEIVDWQNVPLLQQKPRAIRKDENSTNKKKR